MFFILLTPVCMSAQKDVNTDSVKQAKIIAKKEAKKAKAESKLKEKTNLADKHIKTTVYMFGFSNEFGDSTYVLTDISKVDNADLVKKTGFLSFRDSYGYQMQVYVEGTLGLKHQTVAIYFSTKLKAMQKKYAKIKKRYLSKDAVKLITLTNDEFSFKVIELE